MYVGVGLDQAKLGLFSSGKRLASRSVAVVSDLELSGVDSNDGANEKLRLLDSWALHSLEEHPSVFQIVLSIMKPFRQITFYENIACFILTISILQSPG